MKLNLYIPIAILAFGIFIYSNAFGRDSGQWEDTPSEIRQWYSDLKQPDQPNASCCGEADAYYADAFEVTKDGKYIAIITDTRDNVKLHRTPVPVGTRIVIRNEKLNDATKQQNPTGHGIVFLSSGVMNGTTDVAKGDYVYCYLAPGGV